MGALGADGAVGAEGAAVGMAVKKKVGHGVGESVGLTVGAVVGRALGENVEMAPPPGGMRSGSMPSGIRSGVITSVETPETTSGFAVVNTLVSVSGTPPTQPYKHPSQVRSAAIDLQVAPGIISSSSCQRGFDRCWFEYYSFSGNSLHNHTKRAAGKTQQQQQQHKGKQNDLDLANKAILARPTGFPANLFDKKGFFESEGRALGWCRTGKW